MLNPFHTIVKPKSLMLGLDLTMTPLQKLISTSPIAFSCCLFPTMSISVFNNYGNSQKIVSGALKNIPNR